VKGILVWRPTKAKENSELQNNLKDGKNKKATCAAFQKISQRNNPYCDLLSIKIVNKDNSF